MSCDVGLHVGIKVRCVDNDLQGQTGVFCGGVLECLATELKGTKDFSKLYAGIAILGYIASISEPPNTQAFAHLLSFLTHRYPKVCAFFSSY